jgi:hypothetical protein
MADTTKTPSAAGIEVQIRPEARPTAEALAQPFSYINAIRVGNDPFGITLSFFSIPADFADLPDVQAQLLAAEKDVRGPGGPKRLQVAVQLPTVAKVWMPTEFMPDLIQALSSHYSRVVQERASRQGEQAAQQAQRDERGHH